MTQHASTANPQHYCLFETDIGACGVAWSVRGLARLQLPEADRRATERRLRTTSAGALPQDPPHAIARIIADIQAYATGKSTDFSSVALDLAGVAPFHAKIYAAARGIGWGQTTSYGELARLVGAPAAARAVGQALGRNPIPLIIPCHRVLASGGKAGGFSAFGGVASKARLLELEGVRLGQGVKSDGGQASFPFEPAAPRRGC